MKAKTKTIDHEIEPNAYNAHAWIVGKPDIGKNVWIGPFTLIDALHSQVTIGKGCNISTGAQIVSHSTVHRCISEGSHALVDHAPVIIEPYCFIGSNAVILMGSHIGHHCVIGAGAIIKEHSTIPPYSIVAGVPGRVIGSAKKYAQNKVS